MSKKPWERFESQANELLGLEGTAASGATWKDKGDGSTRDNYNEKWPLMVDAKTTEKGSFPLKAKFLDDMRKIAIQDGKTFALPIKFLEEEKLPAWVVVPLEDYAYLVDEYRKPPAEFTDEERFLLRAIATQLKGESLIEMINGILAKMGEES